MTNKEKSNTPPGYHSVRSEIAKPSRPGGYHRVRHPMSSRAVVAPKYPPSDAVLERIISDALEAENRLADTEILVSVRGGVVTLSGQVRLEFQRELAKASVDSVPGVLQVNNVLGVSETGPMARPGKGS